MARQGRLFAMACLVLAMALWGSSFIALKFAFAELPPMWVIFGRMALGSLVFLLAWRWRGRLDYRPGDWRYLLALAACEPCLYFIFEALALQHWQGRGSVALLRAAPRRGALLLERLEQRDLTDEWDVAACEAVGVLYADLHIAPPPQLRRLSQLCGRWSARLRGLPRSTPLPPRLVERLQHYFGTYRLHPGQHAPVAVRELYGAERAAKVVEAAMEDYRSVYPQPLTAPGSA